MKKLLICGATGFIGRNMAEHFAASDQYDVIGVYNKRPPYDLPGLRWVQADLTKAEDVDRIMADADILIQAAATTSGSKDVVARPYIHVTDNAVMNSLLFRAAFEHKLDQVIFFSCTVMLQSSEEALREEDFDANAEIYHRYFGAGWTKVYIEKMCEFYSRIGETKFTTIRHSNVYGPHDKFDPDRSHVFGATITKVLSSKDGKVVVWGAGEEERDLIYIADLVDFVEKAIEKQKTPFGLYNCGAGESVSIRDLVRKIVDISGRDLEIEHDLDKPSIKTSLFLDCTKAERELGWKRTTSLEDGIAKTIDWWRKNISV